MTPYYDEGGITIYHGDCREIVPDLHADTLLTDPPYGIGASLDVIRHGFDASGWDTTPVDVELLDLAVAHTKEAIIWGGNYYELPPSQRFFVWDKMQGQNFTAAMCEMAWSNIPGGAKLFRHDPRHEQKVHPTQKPIQLMRWCLTFSSLAGPVLDPFMGSGTTLVAAAEAGRRAVGIEIEEKYCEIAVQRLAQGVLDFGGVT